MRPWLKKCQNKTKAHQKVENGTVAEVAGKVTVGTPSLPPLLSSQSSPSSNFSLLYLCQTSLPLTSSCLFLLLSGPDWLQSVLLGIVVLLAYRLEFTDTFPVHTQGFFCYDSAYAKPYPGPEAASRAPPALIYALVTAGPTFTVRWCGSNRLDARESNLPEGKKARLGLVEPWP